MGKINAMLRDPECSSNLKCFIIAVMITSISLGGLIYGLALLNHTTVAAEDIAIRRMMFNRIILLERRNLQEHTHKWTDGKVILFQPKKIIYKKQIDGKNGGYINASKD